MNVHEISQQVPLAKATAALEQGQRTDVSFMDTLKESIQQIDRNAEESPSRRTIRLRDW